MLFGKRPLLEFLSVVISILVIISLLIWRRYQQWPGHINKCSNETKLPLSKYVDVFNFNIDTKHCMAKAVGSTDISSSYSFQLKYISRG